MKIAKLLLLTIALSSTALFGDVNTNDPYLYVRFTDLSDSPNQTVTIPFYKDSYGVMIGCESVLDNSSPNNVYALTAIEPVTCIGDQSLIHFERQGPYGNEIDQTDPTCTKISTSTYIAPLAPGSTSFDCWFKPSANAEPIKGHLTINVVEQL